MIIANIVAVRVEQVPAGTLLYSCGPVRSDTGTVVLRYCVQARDTGGVAF